MSVNSNEINLAEYRGEIKRCPLCTSRTPDAALDALTSGRTCRLCLGQTFVAMCKLCDGKGQQTDKSIWDGGRSNHTSTCGPCGGSGVFPVKRPENWVDADADADADSTDMVAAKVVESTPVTV